MDTVRIGRISTAVVKLENSEVTTLNNVLISYNESTTNANSDAVLLQQQFAKLLGAM